MTTTQTRMQPNPPDSEEDSIRGSLDQIEALLERAPESMFDSEYFEVVEKQLLRLHARMRIHHAARSLSSAEVSGETLCPEHADDMSRLQAEHSQILGHLDRIIRSVGSMADRPLEDKEVFFLRIRELLAVVRRHEAEDDRLFYLSVWQDVGGES